MVALIIILNRIDLSLKETKMYAAVLACFYVARMRCEINILAVLYYQPSFWFEHLLCKEYIGQSR